MPLMIIVAMLAVMLLVGCGVKAGGETSGKQDETITVTMKDTMTFVPSALTVKTGQDVKIALTNAGSVVHNFSIEELGVNQTVPPGESATVSFVAPLNPGQYQIVCNEPGHEQAGMIGTLTIER